MKYSIIQIIRKKYIHYINHIFLALWEIKKKSNNRSLMRIIILLSQGTICIYF